MALSNLFGWNKKKESAPAAACGTACGAGDKPEEKPAACGTACGAGDKPEELETRRKKSQLPAEQPVEPAISKAVCF